MKRLLINLAMMSELSIHVDLHQKDPSSRELRHMKSVKVEAKAVPCRTMIPKESHPQAKLVVNESVIKKGPVKLAGSASNASTDVEAKEPCGSASEGPSSSVVDEAAPGG